MRLTFRSLPSPHSAVADMSDWSSTGFMGGYMDTKRWQQDMAATGLNIQEAGIDIKTKQLAYDTAMEELDYRHQMAKMASTMLDQRGKSPEDLPKELTDVPRQMASLAFANGRPLEGLDIITKVTGIEKDVAETRSKVAETEIKNLQVIAREMDATRIYDDVSWKGYWTRYASMHPEAMQNPQINKMVLDNMARPYDPNYVAQIRSVAISKLDEARIRQANAAAAASEANMSLTAARKAELEARAEASQARAERYRKVGGTGGTEDIKPADIRQFADVVGAQYDTTDPTVKARVSATARRGEELTRLFLMDHPEMTLSQAREQVFKEMEGAGELAGLRKLRAGRGSPQNPMPAPTSAEELVKGSWYKGASGAIGFWDGKEFLTSEEVSRRRTTAGLEMPDDSLEEDNPGDVADDGLDVEE